MTFSMCRSASSPKLDAKWQILFPPYMGQYGNKTRTHQGTKRRTRRFFVVARELKYTAQGQEIFGGGLLPGLFLLIVFAVGVVVALALLALT